MQELSQEDRTWGMLCHISSFAGLVIPFGNILGPLVVWMIKKDQSWFVNDQGKEAINFQISLTIYGIIAAILMLVLIGFFLLIALGLAWIILTIMAAMKANEGVSYRYPLTIRLLK